MRSKAVSTSSRVGALVVKERVSVGIDFGTTVIATRVSRTLERVAPPLTARRVMCNFCSLINDMTRACRSKKAERADFLLERDNPCCFARYWVDTMSR